MFGGSSNSHRTPLDRAVPLAGAREAQSRSSPFGRLGVGTLACKRCDAPVALTSGVMSPSDPLRCPFCDHRAPVRDFLSLAAPTRPARVVVRVVSRLP